MSEKKPEKVQEQLENIAKGNYTGNELVFDPNTGELILKKSYEQKPNPDATVVDQIAEDGFFNFER